MKLECGSECLVEGDASNCSLVLLHGVGMEATSWKLQMQAFSSKYYVIAWNAPGYGESKPLTKMNFYDLVESLEQALGELQIQHSHFIGHSFGGMLLQELAAKSPERIRSMVLYGTSPAFGKKDGDWQKEYVQTRLEPLRNGKTLKDLAPKFISELTGNDPNHEGMSLALKSIQRVSNRAFSQVLKCIVNFDRRDNLMNLKKPVLVLSGELDPNAPAVMMERMSSRIPEAQYQCLIGLGHLANLESPDVFNRSVADFLDKQET